MFGKPRCPVDPRQKAWIDSNFVRLIDRFGLDALKQVEVLLPTRAFFPDVFEEAWDAQDVCRRLAGHLGLETDAVHVIVHEDGSDWQNEEGFESLGGACYRDADGQVSVHVYEGLLADAERLVAVLGGEMLRYQLLSSKGADKAFASLTMEVHTVFRGLGVFTANAQLRETGRVRSGLQVWEWSRLGDLGLDAYGYALALFAWLRREGKPAWAAALRPDVALPWKTSLKYLAKTEDALVQPDGSRRDPAALSEWKFQEALAAGTPADRIAALWHLCARGEAEGDVLDALLGNVEHESRIVRSEALWAVRACEVEGSTCLHAVIDALVDEAPDVRVAAVNALTTVCDDTEVLQRELTPVFERGDPPLVEAAALALGPLGGRAAGFVPILRSRLERTLATMDARGITAVLTGLQQITGDARDALDGSVLWDDPEHAGLVEEVLEALAEGDDALGRPPEAPPADC